MIEPRLCFGWLVAAVLDTCDQIIARNNGDMYAFEEPWSHTRASQARETVDRETKRKTLVIRGRAKGELPVSPTV